MRVARPAVAADGAAPSPARAHPPLDLDRRPILVFWEATRACGLACRHCRACAVPEPGPDELTHEEAARFIESLAGFGKPRPILVLTGGDVLMRPDLLELAERAQRLELPVAVSPSVTPLLTREALAALRARGVKTASISLDGATPATHEGVRGVAGHFSATLEALRVVREARITLQVNTVVMRDTVEELPDVARIVRDADASIWEVFFLVQTGRGTALDELSPHEHEDVCHFLFDASRHGFIVRTVEAPFFRRVTAQRLADGEVPDPRARYGLGPLYGRLTDRLREALGEPVAPSKAHTKGTRDGRGIIFVAADGSIYPAGFLPLALGNVREAGLVEIYRDHPLLLDIRASRFAGRCGACEHRALCGGSRARAFAASGDPLGEDPGCAWQPSGAPA